MKAKELRAKSEGDLIKLLEEKREELRKLRFGLLRKEIKNVREISAAKKDIARILTLLHK